jgi:ppGpp synthetase/RelA/SpoT-type nucleotidyltranferase
MTRRTAEDRLREEYFRLSPEITRVVHQLQTHVGCLLLPVTLRLKHHERVQIEGRAKECESAIGALRRRMEGKKFLENPLRQYTLTDLPDLAGIRVSAFPRSRLEEVHKIVCDEYGEWTPDPVGAGARPRILAWKYHGYCSASPCVRAELQVMPMLTRLFWQIEHGAIYKPQDRALIGAADKLLFLERAERVYDAFDEIEDVIERELQEDPEVTAH